MIVRARERGVFAPGALAAAATFGALASVQPKLAVELVAAIALAFIVFADLAAGFAVLGFLSFLDVLSTSASLSPPKAVGLLLAVAWLARFSVGRRQRDFFADHGALTWTAILFLAWAVVSLTWATQAGPGVTAVSRYLPDLLLLPIAYTAIETRRDLVLVLAAIVIGAVVAATFGILTPPDPALVGEGAGRVTGTIGDPNELAASLLVGLALGAGFLLSRGRSLALRVGGAIAIPLCLAGIFLSLSRGGLVALSTLMVAGTILAGRWRIAMAGLLVLVAFGGFLYFTQIASLPARERVTTAQGGSGRTDLWTVGWRMVQAHPINGVGVGNFAVVAADYVLQPGEIRRADLIFSSVPKITHNTYLEVFSEMGIPGITLFMAIILACLSCCLGAARIWSKRGEVGLEAMARSVLLALLGLLVADFFISETYSKLLWVMLALGPAMLGLARREDEGEEFGPSLNELPSRKGRALAAPRSADPARL